MTIRIERRETAIERMADYLLEEGLEAATLRPLAAAAGTSDRMLLYYFVDRDELMSVTLQRIASRLAAHLDKLVPSGQRRPFAELLTEVRNALRSNELRPYMNIWLDLSARASGGCQPYHAVAGIIADGFLDWAEARLDGRNVTVRREMAALFISAINGMHVLESIGRSEVADVALTVQCHRLSNSKAR